MQPKIFFYTTITLIMFTTNIMYGQIKHQITFPKNYSIKQEVLYDGNTYNKINFNDMPYTDSIGYPSLPVKYIKLLVPSESEITELTINPAHQETISLDYIIEPVQELNILDYTNDFVSPDSARYNSTIPYPSVLATIVEESFFRGNKIVTIAIHPFQYNPVKNQLDFFASVDLTLNYTSSSSSSSKQQDRVEIDVNSLTGKVLKYLIDNKEDIGTYGTQYQKKDSSQPENILSTKSLKSVQITSGITIDADYVIVTSEELAPSFNEFINWKRRKGIDVELVTIEDIYSNYSGDLISGIQDNAGELRQFLCDAYNNGNGIDYALLGGDNSVLPIRYGYAYPYTSGLDSNNIVPTDLYFSEFDGDWNNDSDVYYGEPISAIPTDGDAVSYFQEIFIGRIMVTSSDEVKNWTNKVKTYELNPGNGDPSYLTKAFYTQADDMQVDSQATTISDKATWITNTTIFEEYGGGCTSDVPNFPTGSDIIDEFNNHYGFCSFLTHGRPCAIGAASIFLNSDRSCDEQTLAVQCADNTKYKVTAFDNGVSGCGTISENGNGFDNMTNYNHPTINYSLSCITMPFDDFKYVSSPCERNLGESFTCISSGGGPAYLGNTRSVTHDTAFPLFEEFIDAIVDGNFFNIGIAEVLSKQSYGFIGQMFIGSRHTIFSHNLLGCPETEIWTATPTIIGSNLVSENGYNITVNTNGESNCKICLMSAYDNGASYDSVVTNYTSFTFPNVTMPYYVTITKHNKIPYLKNLTTVLFEDKTFNSNAYISCQTLSAGYSVDPNHTPDGNVIIASGASVTFDATGDVLLDNGFEVELGATFEVK